LAAHSGARVAAERFAADAAAIWPGMVNESRNWKSFRLFLLQWVEHPMVRAWILRLRSRPMAIIILNGFDFQTVHYTDGQS
jgi:hypothetical protein